MVYYLIDLEVRHLRDANGLIEGRQRSQEIEGVVPDLVQSLPAKARLLNLASSAAIGVVHEAVVLD